MVKELDDIEVPQLVDHVGLHLWRVSQQWKRTFDAAMQARGYPWLAEARGAVVGQLRTGGRSQAALAAALGISKQAVQQHVDELVAEGVVGRRPDPTDRRGKLVVLSAAGALALAEGNDVKQQIEQRYRLAIGEQRFVALVEALKLLQAAEDEPDPGRKVKRPRSRG